MPGKLTSNHSVAYVQQKEGEKGKSKLPASFPALNTRNPVVIDPAWNTEIESNNDEAEAKKEKIQFATTPC